MAVVVTASTIFVALPLRLLAALFFNPALLLVVGDAVVAVVAIIAIIAIIAAIALPIGAIILRIAGAIAGAAIFLVFAIHRLLHYPRRVAAGLVCVLLGSAALLVLNTPVLVSLRLLPLILLNALLLGTLIGKPLLGVHAALFHALLVLCTCFIALLLLLRLPLLALLLGIALSFTLALLLLARLLTPVLTALAVAAARKVIARHFDIAVAARDRRRVAARFIVVVACRCGGFAANFVAHLLARCAALLAKFPAVVLRLFLILRMGECWSQYSKAKHRHEYGGRHFG
ncbi:MAG: hypothetical protein JSR22_07965 [Proteobacteria bacterium]|nr:hypothetical protein [Pseudomonadota bacterium]